ncbi:MAG: hypothetical protein K2X63_10055 [Burkholderiaceae bacterium]|nr:hypothetical protein [Burkholderiaceae bacterium]
MKNWIYKNWFWPLALFFIFGHYIEIRNGLWNSWIDGQFVEAVFLFDLVLVLPSFYLLCYRAQGKVTLIKALAIACSAIWVCGELLPVEHQQVLTNLAWLRYIGLAGLFVLELRLIASIVKAVFVTGEDTQSLQSKLNAQGMPNWLAKLSALEASIWRRVWLFVRRLATKEKH